MSRPNVLLIVLDAVRKDHLSVYGYDRPTTPNLDAFGEVATRYEQAISAAPWTPPSHGAIFSGSYPSTTGIYGRTPYYPPDQPHVADRFSDLGYSTFGFSNSHHTSKEHNYDRGFDFYHDILDLPRIRGKMVEPSLDYVRHLYDYFRKDYDDSSFQLRRLRTQIRRRERPFFGFINLNSAHSPYDPPEPFKGEFEAYFDAWDDVDESKARVVADDDGYRYIMGDVSLRDRELDLVECWYDGEIRYLDYLLGQFFDFLKERGLFDETLIVVTSDHGEHFGENGLVYHQFSLSDTLLNVPLLIKWPRQQEAEVSNELVSLVDMAPTVLEEAGGRSQPDMDGRNLTTDEEPDAVFAEYAGPFEPMRERLSKYGSRFEPYNEGLQAIRTTDHKLVRTTRGETNLYRVGDGEETALEDEELAVELYERLDDRLAELPQEDDTDGIASHVEDHLEKMGYM